MARFGALVVASLIVAAGALSRADEKPEPAAKEKLARSILAMSLTIEAQSEELVDPSANYARPGHGSTDEILRIATDARIPIGARRLATLRLGPHAGDAGVRAILVGLLADRDAIVAFDAARALACAGRRDGAELLKKVARRELVLSVSEFEIGAAELALVALSEPLPSCDGRHSSRFVDAHELARLKIEPAGQ